MKRHTWTALLLSALIASIGYAGLRRGAWRTAFRYRLIDQTLGRAPQPAIQTAPTPPRKASLRLVEAETEGTELSNWRAA